MSQEKSFWKGASGRTYEYLVYDVSTAWNDVGGNYIFARCEAGRWAAKYIGQTQSFRDRIPNHNEAACVQRNGATHVHAHVNGNEAARKSEEVDLIQAHQPVCNQQHKAA